MTRHRINLTDEGLLPLGLDVDYALSHGDEQVLIAVRDTYLAQHTDQQTSWDNADPSKPILLDHARVTPSQALVANRKLDDLLRRQRWFLIRDARAAGDSWTTIGAALGLTKQGAADWYRRNLP